MNRDWEQHDMTGILFPNDRQGNEKRPSCRGTATIFGKKVDVALWPKVGKKSKFFTLKFTEKKPREEASNPEPQRDLEKEHAEQQSDMPF